MRLGLTSCLILMELPPNKGYYWFKACGGARPALFVRDVEAFSCTEESPLRVLCS